MYDGPGWIVIVGEETDKKTDNIAGNFEGKGETIKKEYLGMWYVTKYHHHGVSTSGLL